MQLPVEYKDAAAPIGVSRRVAVGLVSTPRPLPSLAKRLLENTRNYAFKKNMCIYLHNPPHGGLESKGMRTRSWSLSWNASFESRGGIPPTVICRN